MSTAPTKLTLSVVPGIPLVGQGDDLGTILMQAIERSHLILRPGDILVVAQKVVSKAQGRYVDLDSIEPSARAKKLAVAVNKDPRLVEVILSESIRVVRQYPNVLIVEQRSGFILANAGVDRSNVSESSEGDQVLLLPTEPDMVVAGLRAQLESRFRVRLGVIVSDSFGRPWRQGTAGVALGADGFSALRDLRGRQDLFGRPLETSRTAMADEVASAASLLMGEADEGYPVILVSGFDPDELNVPANALIRPASEDLFR